MTAALVLLDLQHGILHSDKLPWEAEGIGARVEQAARQIVEAARAAGVPVVHVGVARTLKAGAMDEKRTATAEKAGKAPREILPLMPGSRETEFVIPPADGEEVVHKIGVSAFVGTRLDIILRNLGARDIVAGGAFTHMVVDSTVRHGFDLGYRMIVVPELCCAPMSAPHDNALATSIPNFARIESLEQASRRFRE